MKTVICAISSLFLVSFAGKKEGTALDGLWMGAFRSDLQKETMVVKFVSQNEIELYQGEVDESKKATGTFELQGDSILVFTYVAADGKQFTMHGNINKKKNFVEGAWEAVDNQKGEFYLKKQKIQELFIQP